MISVHVDQSVPVSDSYRAARVRSLFNVSPEHGARFTASAEIPLDEPGWQIGLIVGPSGSGKSSIGRRCWGSEAFHEGFSWGGGPIVDEISPAADMDAVTGALSSVGLGTVPAWLRPFAALSTGEKFRAELARLLLSERPRVVIDEFTSVVDRQVARIGALAFSKAWRRTPGRQAILLSCHRDIIEWACPDWVLDTEDMSLQRGCLWRRPTITIAIHQTNWSPWKAFEPHHYLRLPHMIAATNYVATHQGEPVAHCAVATNTGLCSARMCRLVVMPEWQGAGVGLAFMEHVAARWLRGENRYGKPMTTLFHTSHPGLAAALRRRRGWLYVSGRVLGESGLSSRQTLCKAYGRVEKRNFGGHMRAVQGFRYVGHGQA
jgi:ABC-type ATPase involved in cell division/GNAT superfamily N-acetyltransferase